MGSNGVTPADGAAVSTGAARERKYRTGNLKYYAAGLANQIRDEVIYVDAGGATVLLECRVGQIFLEDDSVDLNFLIMRNWCLRLPSEAHLSFVYKPPPESSPQMQ